MLAGRVRDLHDVKCNLTNAGVKEYLTGALEQVLLDWGRTRLRQTRPSRNLRHFTASARSQPSWGSTEPLNQHAETAKRSPLRQSVYHGWSGGSPTRSLRANCLKVGRQQDRRLAGRKSQQIPAVLVGLDDIDLDAGPPHPTLRCPAGGPTSFSALTWISIGVRVEPLACTARSPSAPARRGSAPQPSHTGRGPSRPSALQRSWSSWYPPQAAVWHR